MGSKVKFLWNEITDLLWVQTSIRILWFQNKKKDQGKKKFLRMQTWIAASLIKLKRQKCSFWRNTIQILSLQILNLKEDWSRNKYQGSNKNAWAQIHPKREMGQHLLLVLALKAQPATFNTLIFQEVCILTLWAYSNLHRQPKQNNDLQRLLIWKTNLRNLNQIQDVTKKK